MRKACKLHRALAPEASKLARYRACRADALGRVARLHGGAHLVKKPAFGVVGTGDEIVQADEVVARKFVGALQGCGERRARDELNLAGGLLGALPPDEPLLSA